MAEDNTNETPSALPSFSFETPPAVASAAEQIMDAEPEVQQHAIDQHLASNQEASSLASGAIGTSDSATKFDDLGTPFNAEIHTGSKLKSGAWRLKKSANPSSKSYVGKPGDGSAKAGVVANSQTSVEAQTRAAAMVTNQMVVGICRGLFDADEWESTKDEDNLMVEAWYVYLLSRGQTEIPPGLFLCVALGSYALPRLRQPKTAEKVGAIKAWIVLRVIKWRVKRALKREGVDADVVIKDRVIYVNGEAKYKR
jgi:hypothetical protein